MVCVIINSASPMATVLTEQFLWGGYRFVTVIAEVFWNWVLLIVSATLIVAIYERTRVSQAGNPADAPMPSHS